MAAFIPVMRIDSVCGIAELSYNLGTSNGKEKIVVAVPLDLKLHVGILKAIRTFKTNLKSALFGPLVMKNGFKVWSTNELH